MVGEGVDWLVGERVGTAVWVGGWVGGYSSVNG